MGSEFSFRQRFELHPVGARLPFSEESAELERENGAVIELRSRQHKPIRESTELVILGSGFSDEASARAAGRRWISMVQRGLAALNVPANFGTRNPSLGGFAPAVVEHIEQRMREALGMGERVAVYNESWDLLVFPSNTTPVFAGAGGAGFAVRAPEPVALRAFEASRAETEPINQVAFDLYGASSRVAHIADARLVLLVMALESMATRMERPQASLDHLDQLVRDTQGEPELDDQERQSLANALGSLRSEPIGGAVRRLAKQLDGDCYHFSPAEVIRTAVRMRNDLVHGGTPPDLERVRVIGADLEVLVGDLLAGDRVVRGVRDARASSTG